MSQGSYLYHKERIREIVWQSLIQIKSLLQRNSYLTLFASFRACALNFSLLWRQGYLRVPLFSVGFLWRKKRVSLSYVLFTSAEELGMSSWEKICWKTEIDFNLYFYRNKNQYRHLRGITAL